MTDSSSPEPAPTIRSHPRFLLQPDEARRTLRFELERLLLETGVRHATLAAWFGVSRPSVTQAVAGTIVFRRPALEVLCRNIDRQEWFPRLDELRRLARRRGAAAEDAVRPPAPRDADLLVGLEAFADSITIFDPYLIPPHLQTHMYAAALGKLDDLASNTSRERRHAPLLDARDPLGLRWITSEHALYRRFGSPAVLHDQLAHLVALAQRPNVAIQIIPAHVELPPTSPFQLIEGTPPVVVEHSRLAVHYAHEPQTLAYFTRLLGDLARRALTPEASVALIAGLLP